MRTAVVLGLVGATLAGLIIPETCLFFSLEFHGDKVDYTEELQKALTMTRLCGKDDKCILRINQRTNSTGYRTIHYLTSCADRHLCHEAKPHGVPFQCILRISQRTNSTGYRTIHYLASCADRHLCHEPKPHGDNTSWSQCAEVCPTKGSYELDICNRPRVTYCLPPNDRISLAFGIASYTLYQDSGGKVFVVNEAFKSGSIDEIVEEPFRMNDRIDIWCDNWEYGDSDIEREKARLTAPHGTFLCGVKSGFWDGLYEGFCPSDCPLSDLSLGNSSIELYRPWHPFKINVTDTAEARHRSYIRSGDEARISCQDEHAYKGIYFKKLPSKDYRCNGREWSLVNDDC